MNATFIVIALLIVVNCTYFFFQHKRNRSRIILSQTEARDSSQAIGKMLLGSIAGFVLFAFGTWLLLFLTSRFVILGNQYAGPPGIMICIIIGLFGMIPGSMLGLIGKRPKS